VTFPTRPTWYVLVVLGMVLLLSACTANVYYERKSVIRDGQRPPGSLRQVSGPPVPLIAAPVPPTLNKPKPEATKLIDYTAKPRVVVKREEICPRYVKPVLPETPKFDKEEFLMLKRASEKDVDLYMIGLITKLRNALQETHKAIDTSITEYNDRCEKARTAQKN